MIASAKHWSRFPTLTRTESAECHQWLSEGLRLHGHNLTRYGLYGQHGEGTQGSTGLQLQQIAAHVKSVHGPWASVGDFNVTPAEAISAGWLSLVSGVALTADSRPTDRMGG
jgi:hypothetical protein